MMLESKKYGKITPWIMWGPVVLFFMYQFIVRVSPGVMQDDIMRRFSISALEFGFLSSIFYVAYALMQLPVGVLLDRYGPRFTAAGFLSMILIGLLVFIYAQTWTIALLGRALIGMGSAGGLLSTAKVARMWFDDHTYGKVLGISVSIGVSGALYGNWPLTKMIGYFGSEMTLFALFFLGLILCFVIISVIKNQGPRNQDFGPSISIWEEIKDIKNHAVIIKLAIYGGLIGPFLYAYGDTWGISYLTTIHELTKEEASGAISALYIGVILGMPFTVYIGDKINSEKMLTVIYGFLTLILFSVLFFVTQLSYPIIIGLHFCYGVLCGYQILLFSIVAKEVDVEKSAFVTSIVNMLNMAFGALAISLIGFIMHKNWDGVIDENNVHIYSNFSYQLAFGVLLIGLLIGTLGVMGTKTTAQK